MEHKKMTQKELDEILELHKLWVECKGGKRTNLNGIDLSKKDLSSRNLSEIKLKNVNLSNANLNNTILVGAICDGVDLGMQV